MGVPHAALSAPGSIVRDAYAIAARAADAAIGVDAVRVGDYAVTVRLADGSIGFAMNYGRLPPPLRGVLAAEYLELAASPRRLRAWIEEKTGDPFRAPAAARDVALTDLAARVATVSAYSSGLLWGEGGPSAPIAPPAALFAGVTTAIVVGFGGLLEDAARAPDVRRVIVVDDHFTARPQYLRCVLDRLRREQPAKSLLGLPPRRAPAAHDRRSLVAITGSALCNNSMEAVLAKYAGCRIVVSGGSAAIVPTPLFARGVDYVFTTIHRRAADRSSDGGDNDGTLEAAARVFARAG